MSIDWNNPLPREQIRPFLDKSNWSGLRLLAFNWGGILACFALVMWHPSVLTVVAAIVILGGRQLGLGILMHETAHRSLMKSGPVNDWVGQWLCAAPMFVDLLTYRRYHMTHHARTGTEQDPDLGNYANYPVSTASLLRKMGRDLSGRSGVRALLSLMFLYASRDPEAQRQGYSYTQDAPAGSRSVRTLLWNVRRILAANAVMLGLCALAGHAAAYLLWPVSWLTTYMLFSRIRNAAEHGALPGTRSTDMWSNTRTVRAAWWERLTVAPNYVNFHVEHHLVPAVPSYNLPSFHRWLVQHGAYERAVMEPGYLHVVRRMVGMST